MDPLRDVNDDLFLAANDFARDTSWLHNAVVGFAKYGVLLFGLALLAGLLYSRRDDARSLAAAVWAGFGTLIAVGLNQPLGNAIHESRPYAVHPHALLLVSPTTDFSFPSDHAVMAGAVAAGLLIVSWRIGLIVAAAAAVMAFARVYVGAHYPADVVAGIAVGALVVGLGWLLLRQPLTVVASRLRSSRLRPLLVQQPRDAPG
ncbi:MAG: phosphatase PAP2 family protein [Nocardioidaceae bacterium]